MLLRTLIAAAMLSFIAAAPLQAQPAPGAPITTDADFIAAYYGLTRSVAVRPSAPVVGTTAVRTNLNAPARFAILMCNLSVNTCYMSPLPSVSSTNGFPLTSNGGCFLTNARDDLLLPTSEFYTVCAGASSQLYMQETYLGY